MLAGLSPNLHAAKPHPAVRAALAYDVPENNCTKPKSSIANKTVTAPTQDSGSASFFEGSNTSEVSDVDTYARARIERKEKRWKKCLAKYKDGLLDDMERLKASAQHGLTQEQANTILASMARIQSVYMHPDGVLVEPEPES